MDDRGAAVDRTADASWATHGTAIGISGAVAVGLGAIMAAEYPVLAAVAVGVPVGLAAWMGAREAFTRTVGWPPANSMPDRADEDPPDPGPTGAP